MGQLNTSRDPTGSKPFHSFFLRLLKFPVPGQFYFQILPFETMDWFGKFSAYAYLKILYASDPLLTGDILNSFFQVLICDDSGALSIWSINENEAWKQWKDEATVAEHDSMIMAVDCLEAEKQYVTVGADCHIKVVQLSIIGKILMILIIDEYTQ